MNTIISIDWLSFNYYFNKTTEELQNNIYIFNEVKGLKQERLSGTNIFNERLIVRDAQGQKIATLLFSPISNILNSNLCIVEMANVTLYNGYFHKFIAEDLPKIHQGQINTLTRLDICCDFDSDNGKFAEMFDKNEIYVSRKRCGSAFYNYIMDNTDHKIKRCIKQFSWGAKETQVKWKLYNKTLEINSESGKEYIKEYWQRNGIIQYNGDVWRLEVSFISCSSIELLTPEGYNLLNVIYICNHLPEYIFRIAYNKHFVVRKNQGNINASRNEIYDIFGWYGNFKEFSGVQRKISLDSVPNSSIYSLINSLCYNLLKVSEVKYNENIALKSYYTLKEIVNEYNCDFYLEERYNTTLEKIYNNIINLNKIELNLQNAY